MDSAQEGRWGRVDIADNEEDILRDPMWHENRSFFDPLPTQASRPQFLESFRDEYFAQGSDKILQKLSENVRRELGYLAQMWRHPYRELLYSHDSNEQYIFHRRSMHFDDISMQYDILAFALFRYKVGILTAMPFKKAELHLEAINTETQRLQMARLEKQRATGEDTNARTKLEKETVPMLSRLLAEFALEQGELSDPKEKSRLNRLYNGQNAEAREYYNVELESKKSKESRTYIDRNGKEQTGDRHIWCPILQRYDTERKMAHLIPRKLGTTMVHGILGVDPEVELLYQRRMVLFIHQSIEAQYDRGALTFIPSDFENEKEEFGFDLELYVVDGSLGKNALPKALLKEFGLAKAAEPDKYLNRAELKTWADLHRRKLVFKNDKRPSRRILFLHHILCEERFRLKKWKAMPGSDVRNDLFQGEARVTPGAFSYNTVVGNWAKLRGELLVKKFISPDATLIASPLSRPHPDMIVRYLIKLSVNQRRTWMKDIHVSFAIGQFYGCVTDKIIALTDEEKGEEKEEPIE